jgi:predicted metal-dependent hydrolase
MRVSTRQFIHLGGRRMSYRVVRSQTARRLRVRIGLSGVEVVQPVSRAHSDVSHFLRSHQEWILGQLERVEMLQEIRLSQAGQSNKLLFRGQPISVRLVKTIKHLSGNKVTLETAGIVIYCSAKFRTPPARSLEAWLRKQARREIGAYLAEVIPRVKRAPKKVYVMGQRTKWGNCSARNILSFNWRLILAPPFVLRYLVTHEAVHLAVPDHSHRFWLTVRSLCPEAERAKQWLTKHTEALYCDLSRVCED